MATTNIDTLTICGKSPDSQPIDVLAYLEKADRVEAFYYAFTAIGALEVIDGGNHDEPQQQRLGEAETRALMGMVRTRACAPFEIRLKLEVYRRLVDNGDGGDWYDRRDALMLESIQQDVTDEVIGTFRVSK